MPENLNEQTLFVRRAHPRVRAVYPNWAALLGAGLIAAGCGAVAAALWMPELPNRFVLALVGANFSLIGALVLLPAHTGVRLRARARDARGKQPWRYDHRWNMRGSDDGSGWRLANQLKAVGIAGFFLLPFHILVYNDRHGDGGFFPWVILGLFDVILLIALCHAVYLLMRVFLFGRPRLIFQRFPYFTGEAMPVTFSGGRRLADHKELKAELHCIKEYYEWTGTGEDSSARHVNESVYRDSLRFSTDRSGMAELRFLLPRDSVSTDLIGDPNANPPRSPHYWELVVTSEQPGIDYEGIFLLPVYRPD